jgi:hypothetical protein
MNTMTLEEIQNLIEDLEAEIEEKQRLIKQFENDDYGLDHFSNINQAKSLVQQLKMEVDQLQIKIDTEDYYDFYED